MGVSAEIHASEEKNMKNLHRAVFCQKNLIKDCSIYSYNFLTSASKNEHE